MRGEILYVSNVGRTLLDGVNQVLVDVLRVLSLISDPKQSPPLTGSSR